MKSRVTARLALLSSFALLVAGAFAADSYTAPPIDAFKKSVRKYPFVAAAPRREKIRAGVPTLKRCMTSAEVRKIIGDPDFGYDTYRSGGVLSKRIWHYILEKKEALETEPSSSVVAWFDGGEKLQTVAVHGAADIEASISRRNDPCP
jgi:outer membrane protein assembly factor BamE (lipoprotein component of BamABCDE complex)